MVGLNINAEEKKREKHLWISTANKIKALILWHPTIMGGNKGKSNNTYCDNTLRMDFHLSKKKEKMIWNRRIGGNTLVFSHNSGILNRFIPLQTSSRKGEFPESGIYLYPTKG